MGMDPVQWVYLGLQLLKSAAEIDIIVWLIRGGWKFLLRTIGFWIDTLLASFIGRMYDYFLQIIEGNMFNAEVINELLKNIYTFIGIIMFFRLMMLVIKYLINPDLVNEAKTGVNKLVQRCIFGLAGILFMPTLFNFALDFQSHIMEDSLIQQIVIPHDMITKFSQNVEQGGKYIGTYVLAGFISPSENATKKIRDEYNSAISVGDLSGLSTLSKDGFLSDEYQYDYFFIMSTFCLCYVLYIMFKYTIDALGRYFRLLMYQVLAPIAMIEYMINGSEDGVFKAWQRGALSTYFMLFIRVMALWFVVFVLILMQNPSNVYTADSLLATNDYLLRALIIVALLGFMLDFPKLMSQVFNLDFEQEGNATGMLKQIGGMVKGAAVGALAVGGSAVAGTIGVGKALGSTALNAKFFKDGNGNSKSLKDSLNSKINNNSRLQSMANKLNNGDGILGALGQSAKENNLQKHLSSATGSIMGAALGSNQYTGSAYKGYKDASNEQKSIDSKAKAESEEKLRHEQLLAGQEKIAKNQEIDRNENTNRVIVERTIETLDANASKAEIMQGVYAQKYSLTGTLTSVDVPSITAEVSGQMTSAVVASMPAMSGTNNDIQTVTQQVHQVLSQKMEVPVGEVEQRVRQVLANGGSLSSPADVEQVVNQVVTGVVSNRIQSDEQSITQIVNQTYGTRVNNSVDNATQTINQQVDIQRNIETNTSNTAAWTELTSQNSERSANSLDEIKRDTNDINSKM